MVTIALFLLMRNLAAALGGPYQRTPGTNLRPSCWGRCRRAAPGLRPRSVRARGHGAVLVLLKKTWLGLALRASAQSRVGAQTAGVDCSPRPARVRHRSWPRRACRRVARAGVPGFPTNGVVTPPQGLRDHRYRRPRLDPRRAVAGVLLGSPNRSARPSSPRPTRTPMGSSSCCSC